MGSPSDTFATFVEVLTEALDEHEATGAELAKRAHLSRFHIALCDVGFDDLDGGDPIRWMTSHG